MSDRLLEIDNLYIAFDTARGQLKAVNGVSFSVKAGEIFGVVGETGSGKTITGLSVLQLLPSSASIPIGEIRFKGKNMLSLSEKEMRAIRGHEIAVIFQDPSSSLNPVFSIGEQLMRVIRLHLKVSKKDAAVRAEEMLTAVGLADPERIMKSYPHQLSGGMKQRVMIALALSCRPSLIIADEPTTALDVTIQAQILKLLQQLQKEFDVAVLFITHNLGVVANSCERVAVLYAGQVMETATTELIFSQPHHPYTKGLMEAIPRAGSRGKKLTAIKGSVPANPGAVVGCAFAARCPSVFERCHKERPILRQLSKDHETACFLDEKGEIPT